MKGLIFTEFMEMIEKNWGMDMVDDLIDDVDPKSGAAYTSVGTYDYEELVAYVGALSKRTTIAIPQLIHSFGIYLAASFANKFPDFFNNEESTFGVLKKVDNHIHIEVRKLYPDAELPKFSYEEYSDKTLKLYYESSRGLADLAHGLIEGCAGYFNENITVSREGRLDGNVNFEDFTLTLN